MRIIGIDPGTYRTGYGIIDDEGAKRRVVSYGCIENKSKRSSERYLAIYNRLLDVIREYKPQHCSIESTFFLKNPKVVMRLGEVRGVLILAAVQEGLEVFEYPPLKVKQSVVGYGRADKNQVAKMVKSMLALKELPKPDDVSDALALALCHIHNRKTIRLNLVKTI